MKIGSYSIVVGNATCNANCPFCVSKMTGQATSCDVNWRRFDVACRLAQVSGVTTALLTGKGEPTLWPDLLTQYLAQLAHYDIPIVELQTNGILIEKQRQLLRAWCESGLSLVCISIAHYLPAASNRLMGMGCNFNFWAAVDILHEAGLSVRLNCTMLRDGISSWVDVRKLIDRCKEYHVDQLTLRDVAVPSRSVNLQVEDYARRQRADASETIRQELEDNGATPVLHLPHGAIVFDYRGQNVCVNNCLTTDPDEIRQLIFFSDGRVAYDWTHPGARFL